MLLEFVPEGLRRAAGAACETHRLSWEEFAERLGVECERVTEWRGGEVPTGGEAWHIMRLALSIPGGTEVMLPQNAGPNERGERMV